MGQVQPRRLLYATSARIGGAGLDAVVLESLLGAMEGNYLGRAIAYGVQRPDLIPTRFVKSLRWHPVRLLSGLGSEYYYGAKKRVADASAARELRRASATPERYDLFHTWSGDSLHSLRAAKNLGVATVLEIPTWHRHKGKEKPLRLTKSERERAQTQGWQGWKNRLLVPRQQVLEEYALADLILCLSQKAEETFLAAGIPAAKLFRHQRGVDVNRFVPAPVPPEIFRVVFVGALIKRKGVHHLLEVWRRLALKDAELVLAGSAHPEMEPWLREAPTNVRVLGFVARVEDVYRSASVHVFPSTCEGSAKATYEAAAAGLPQITTRESGDVVIDGQNGIIIPPDDPDALAEAILRLYRDRALAAKLGAAGRARAIQHFTWEHFRSRLRQAYDAVLTR